MKILIVGYGRMGHEVEKICLERNHQIVGRIDQAGKGDARELSAEWLKKADGVVEFSLPQGIEKNLKLYAEAETPAVIGTTGWDDKKQELSALFKQKGSLLHGSNFSLGAHMFFALTAKAASMINNIPEYDVMVTEYHHKLKKDSPSGTAISTAEVILKNCDRKKTANYDRINREIREDELHVASIRGGQIPGIHQVLLDSLADSVEIKHTARNRSGFALGSVMALEWLQDKQGFFSVDEFIQDVI